MTAWIPHTVGTPSAMAYRTLAPGEMLNWYRIDAVLGRGGFGVIYRATDTNLDHPVAIKEYIPHVFAQDDGHTTVRPSGVPQADLYRWGLERFIKEARNLVRFKHPNIVRVMSVFQQNDTAYMVMEFEAGVELGGYLADAQACDEGSLKALIGPVCEGLLEVHRHGFIHRDIKPANILVRPDGSPVLLDFGSARDASLEQKGGLTALVTAGYAPLEQYDHTEQQQQGPWTDIYALGGVLYHAISGNDPVDSARRASALLNGGRDPLIAAATVGRGRYGARFLAAIDWALEFRIADRPQSVQDWLPALLGSAAMAGRGTASAKRRPAAPTGGSEPGERTRLIPSAPSELPGQASGQRARPARQGPRVRSGPELVGAARDQPVQPNVLAQAPTEPWARLVRALGLQPGQPGGWRGLSLASLGVAVLLGVLLLRDDPLPNEPAAVALPSAADDTLQEQRARLAELERREQAFEQRQARALAQAEEARLARVARLERERLEAEEAERQARERLAEQQRAVAVRRAAERAEASKRFTRALDEAQAALDERRIGAARAAVQVAAATGFSGQRLSDLSNRLDEVVAEMRRPVSDLEFDRVVQRFDRLKRAIENKDRELIEQLTEPSDQLALFQQLMQSFDRLNMEITGIRVRNAEKSVSANLRIRDMVRENGDSAVPSEAFRDREITSHLEGGTWSAIVW